MAIDDNPELNTKTQVWLEFGKAFYEHEIFNRVMTTHDIDLDCGADTFEEAIIELAELVQRKTYKNKQCEFCILDNEDNINTCTLFGKQAFDICISKEYIPNKNNCDRYKRKKLNK